MHTHTHTHSLQAQELRLKWWSFDQKTIAVLQRRCVGTNSQFEGSTFTTAMTTSWVREGCSVNSQKATYVHPVHRVCVRLTVRPCITLSRLVWVFCDGGYTSVYCLCLQLWICLYVCTCTYVFVLCALCKYICVLYASMHGCVFCAPLCDEYC